MTGLLICAGYASASCLTPLTNDQLVKNGKDSVSAASIFLKYVDGSESALNLATSVFRTMLAEQNIESFAANLKRGNIRDLLLFFPPTKRDSKHLEAHFKAADLPQIVDWYLKRQNAIVKDAVTKHLKEMVSEEEDAEAVRSEIGSGQERSTHSVEICR